MDNPIAVKAVQIRHMFSTSNITQITSLILAGILSYMLRDVIGHTLLMGWFSLIVLVTVSRTVLAISFQRTINAVNQKTNFWLRSFRIGVLASGLVWGLVSLLLFPSNQIQHQAFIAAMLCGLAAGGLTSYSVDFLSGIVYVVSVLLPLIVRMLYEGGSFSVAMGMALLLYLCFMIMSVRYMNRNLSENISLQLEAAEREEEVRISEQRYRLLLEHSPAGIFHYDINLVITYCNVRFAEIMKSSSALIIGMDMKSLKDQSIVPALKKAIDGEVGYYEGFYAATFSKVQGWTAMTCAPSLDREGKIIGGVAIVQDITERKQADEAISKISQRLQIALEGSQISVWELDTRTGEVWLDAGWATFLGQAPSETHITFTELLDKVHPEDRASAIESSVKSLKGEIDRYFVEHRVMTANGEWKWVLSKGRVVERDASGRALRVSGTNTNITERKNAEVALSTSHQEMYSLLNSMAEGAYGVDTKGNCTFINGAFLQILGYGSSDEILGKHIHTLIHHSHPNGTHYPATECKMYNAYRRNEKIHVSNEVFWHKDGRSVPVEYWSQPIVVDGVVKGAIATFIDITERKRIENELIASEQRLRSIIETEPECIKVLDSTGRLLEMNAAGLAMLEVDSLEEAQRCSILEYVDQEDHAAFMSLHRQVMNGESGMLVFKIKGLRGTRRYLETHAVPMRDANGDITSLLGITRDITERKNSEQQLRVAAAAFESQEGMLVTDAHRVILRVNDAFTHITGYSADEVIGQTQHILNSGRHDESFYAAMWHTININGYWEGEIWERRKSGEIYPERLTITAVKSASGEITNYVATLTDITQSKKAEDEIKNLAFYDPLTQLPNRRLLLDRLSQAMATSERSGEIGALLFIDLDNFKTVNDTLGHAMGDSLLREAAARLKSCVREGDTVARLGGDEFVVMLEELDDKPLDAATQAEVIGEKVLATLNQTYLMGEKELCNTPSIGITLFNGSQLEPDDLFRQADIAMYQSKEAGRNTLRFFDPKMQEAINQRSALEIELRKAIDQHQFQLYYQIQMDYLQSPIGAEVLVRWNHPERGMVSPAQFIPIAEETGLILPIGHWVLETACAQLKDWQAAEQTRDLILSVNVSAKQFHQTDFVAQVHDVLQRYGINPMLLKLEITESMLLLDIDDMIATMVALNEIGVRISLDDFGTGYSSLQYLKRLPLYQLKIDQSFVRDLAVDKSDKAIVDTIISMAHSLNLDVIAEGVETEEQRQYLENAGCPNYQGYLFSKPVPVREFEALVKTCLNEINIYSSNPIQGSELQIVTAPTTQSLVNWKPKSESLEIFAWNESFTTGISLIDEQHKQLVQLINGLAKSIASKADLPELNKVFGELADYAVYHFQTEETIWHQYLAGDALETTHNRVHEGFITDVLKLKINDSLKPQEEVVEEILSFLVNWLAFHILESDKRMAMVVLAMRSGMSLAKAKQHVVRGSRGATQALIVASLSMYNQLSKQTLQLMKEVNERKSLEEKLLQMSRNI